MHSNTVATSSVGLIEVGQYDGKWFEETKILKVQIKAYYCDFYM